jgi:hypothetical protein
MIARDQVHPVIRASAENPVSTESQRLALELHAALNPVLVDYFFALIHFASPVHSHRRSCA